MGDGTTPGFYNQEITPTPEDDGEPELTNEEREKKYGVNDW